MFYLWLRRRAEAVGCSVQAAGKRTIAEINDDIDEKAASSGLQGDSHNKELEFVEKKSTRDILIAVARGQVAPRDAANVSPEIAAALLAQKAALRQARERGHLRTKLKTSPACEISFQSSVTYFHDGLDNDPNIRSLITRWASKRTCIIKMDLGHFFAQKMLYASKEFKTNLRKICSYVIILFYVKTCLRKRVST